MRYKLIRANTSTSLTDEVNSYLAAGWKLHERAYVAYDGYYYYHYQAVILENS